MNRFALARREAAFCLLLTLLYFFAWYGTAYFIPLQLELWGLPLWFLLSCMVMPLLFILLCALMVSRLFVEIPLDTLPLASKETSHES
ncbi:YhdT family protein [Aeromonas sp. MdU4]|uniref:YhdT family protein n=1 Tax=Aeromonas sp. MdU4 TaxID=3342819 RepID=UPI0035BA90AD